MDWISPEKKMMLNCVLLLALLRLTMGAVSPELREKLNRSKENVRTALTIAKNMATDESTRPSVSGGVASITQKSRDVGTKWMRSTKLEFKKDPEGNAAKVGEAMSGVGNGMVSFVNGIKNKDWKSGVQGTLTMISSVLALAGPEGMIASAVLSLISSLLSLFGGNTESMEEKLARIIDEAREKDLKMDVEGLKVTYESLSNSIQHFRESKKLEEDQANELYNHAFTELPVFGRLLARMKEICDNVETKRDPYGGAGKCIDIIQTYVELSVIRQALITNMAALMADVHEREHGEYVRGTELNNEGGLLVVSNNLLNLIKKEKEKERLALSFLIDPFNNPPRRYICSIYFANPDKYSTLKTYIKSLQNDLPGGFFKKYSMVCKDPNLQGDCITLEKGNYPNQNSFPNDFKNAVSSFYIPFGLQITAWEKSMYGGSKWGPFPGPIVHGSTTKDNDYDSLKVESTTRDADNEVRFCEEPNMGLGRCDTAPVGKHNLKGYNGYDWEKKVKSMYVPPGLRIYGYTKEKGWGSSYRRYPGPLTVNLVYDENNWRSISIREAEEDAKEDAQVCDQENLGGHCIAVGHSYADLSKVGGTDFKHKVRSLKIPGGMHITGYQSKNMIGAKIGPYQGAATISRVDDGDRWESLKVVVFSKEIPEDNS